MYNYNETHLNVAVTPKTLCGDKASKTSSKMNGFYITFKLLSREHGEPIHSVYRRVLQTPRVRVEKSLPLHRVLIYGQK